MSDLTRSGSDKPRPQYRNIHVSQIVRYRLPPAGIVSILHRISGGLLFLSLPITLYLFDRSLTSELSFEAFKGFTSHWFVKLVLLAMLWAFLQHICGGIRHLAMDLHLGVDKQNGQKTALGAITVAGVLWVVIGLKLIGAF